MSHPLSLHKINAFYCHNWRGEKWDRGAGKQKDSEAQKGTYLQLGPAHWAFANTRHTGAMGQRYTQDNARAITQEPPRSLVPIFVLVPSRTAGYFLLWSRNELDIPVWDGAHLIWQFPVRIARLRRACIWRTCTSIALHWGLCWKRATATRCLTPHDMNHGQIEWCNHTLGTCTKLPSQSEVVPYPII